MAQGIGAGGLLGVALEVTPGTYVAPSKYIPIMSESVKMVEETQFRRPIRQSAAVIGAVAGNEHPEGDIELEGAEDWIIYFLLAARATTVKTGSIPNFTYTTTPNSNALPNRTLSLTIVRSDIVFGYVGCTVGQFKFSVSNGMLMFGASIIARDEAVQSSPTATWPTSGPFGAGQYSIEIPTASPVTDVDTYEWTCNDNAEAQFRLKSTGRKADFVKFGERELTISLGRDFASRTDYDAFKAVTAQTITMTMSKGANNSVSLLTPVVVKDTYEVGLNGQGDLVRAQIQYRPMIDATGKDYQIVTKCQEDLTP